MLITYLNVLLLVGVVCNNVIVKRHVLHIGGTFPMTGAWSGGPTCKPAVQMAIEDINNRADILPDFRLELHAEDSQCNPGLGTTKMYDLLYNEPVKVALLTGCSMVTTYVAQAAAMFNLIVLSYGASSPALSNRTRFPTFFRTHPSATDQNPTRVELMRRCNWTKVSLLYENVEVFVSTIKNLTELARSKNITITNKRSLQNDPAAAVEALRESTTKLKLIGDSVESRIIIGLFYEASARKVMCEAYHKKVYGPKYVWILIGWYKDDWWSIKDPNIDCTLEQMREATNGHFTSESEIWNYDKGTKKISSKTTEQFEIALKSLVVNATEQVGYLEAPLAYDAVWALALALHEAENTLKMRNTSLLYFNYSNSEMKNVLYETMKHTNFRGISGTVNFDAEGSRIGYTKIEQMQNGTYKNLGRCFNDKLQLSSEPVWLEGNSPPKDSLIFMKQYRSLSQWLFFIMTGVASLLILFALGCGLFLVMFWHHKALNETQPGLSVLLIVGCILCLSSVFLFGFDRLTATHKLFEQSNSFSCMCHLKIWFLVLGFSLAYGALFNKIWVVYRHSTLQRSKSIIMSNNGTSQNQNQYRFAKDGSQAFSTIKPSEGAVVPIQCTWTNYMMVFGLCALDIMLMASWQIIQPMEYQEKRFLQIDDPEDSDVINVPYIKVCQAQIKNMYLWYGLILGNKILVMMFGLLLAYETRNIKLGQNSDSRLAAIAIYNVFVLSAVTAPVTLAIEAHQDAFFAYVSIPLCAVCGLTMGLLFLPKIRVVWQDPERNSSEQRAVLNGKSSKIKFSLARFVKPISAVEDTTMSVGVTDNASSTVAGTGAASNNATKWTEVYTGENVLQQDTDPWKSEEEKYRNLLIKTETLKKQVEVAEKLGEALKAKIVHLVQANNLLALLSTTEFSTMAGVHAGLIKMCCASINVTVPSPSSPFKTTIDTKQKTEFLKQSYV